MKTLEQNIINLYGEKGRQWQENLPNLVAQLGRVNTINQSQDMLS